MRPCPFCNSENLRAISRVIPRQRGQEYHWYIRCNTCGARGPLKLTDGEAVIAWDNDRGVKCQSSTPNLFDEED